MKKLITFIRNAGRCTEPEVKWLGWYKKPATSTHLQNPNWPLSSGSQVSAVWAQRFEMCQLLCLHQIFNSTFVNCQQGTFVKLNKASVNTLRIVEPYIAFVAVIQSLSCVWLLATLWAAACQASLSFAISQSLLKLTSIESMMPSNHLILCRPLLLLGLFRWVGSLRQVAKVLELPLQHQSFQWLFRVDFF